MKITKSFLDLLKNLSKINRRIHITPGNKFLVDREDNNAKVFVNLKFDIPQELRIADSSNFVNICSKFDSPELEIFDDSCTVKESEAESFSNDVRFFSVYLIEDASNTDSFDEYEGDGKNSFELTKAEIKKILDLASIQDLDLITFILDSKGVAIHATNPEDKSANKMKFQLQTGNYSSNKFYLSRTDLEQLVLNDYVVSLLGDSVISFTTKNGTDAVESIKYIFTEKDV